LLGSQKKEDFLLVLHRSKRTKNWSEMNTKWCEMKWSMLIKSKYEKQNDVKNPLRSKCKIWSETKRFSVEAEENRFSF
jgi:hypothetical protein